jgi:hypothetical protein
MTLHPLTIEAVNNYHQAMEKPMPKIRVLDQLSDQVLFECSIEESEKAYQFAAEMEEMGLDLKMDVPTLSETLSESLGLSREQQAAYKQSMEAELEDHDGSCCFKDGDPDKLIN